MPRRPLPAGVRSVLFWAHLTLGVSAGVIIFIMSLTGLLLGYERQVIAWIDGAPAIVAAPGAVRLSLDDLFARAGIAPADVESFVVKADPRLPVLVGFRSRTRVPAALDPFTAAMRPMPKPGSAQGFFEGLRTWHQALGVKTGPPRDFAAAVAAAASLLCLLLVPMGVYLWWPARWTTASLGATMLFRGGLRGRARNFNWHNVVGVWSAVPLFLIALTAVLMSYRTPVLWLDRALGSPAEQAAAIAASKAPARPAAPNAPAPAPAPKPAVPPTFVKEGAASPSVLFAVLERRHPAWQTVTVGMPSARESAVQVYVAEGNTFRPDLRETMFLDPVTTATTRVVSYGAMSASRRIRSWVRYSHTGEAFGVAGQTVATMASAGGALLAWTGLSLAWRRFSRWRAGGISARSPTGRP